MIRNIQVTKKGDESDNQLKTLFTSPNSWEEGGGNLVLYKNNKPLVRDLDYQIQDDNTIQLTTAAKNSDELNFIITQIVDPSEMYSHDERMHQLDKINKKMEGKAQTSIEKRVTEETIPSKFIIHSKDIWASKINPSPAIAKKENTAKAYVFFSLTEDKTVGGEKGWFASGDGQMSGRITNWIPPEFGKPYTIRLYDATNNEIPSSDPMGWRWDYQAGYLIIENEFTYQTPFKISGFQYSGRFGVGSLTHWKEPVFSLAYLPLFHNDDGDVRLILTENKFYRFDSLANKWDPLNYGSQSFQDPVLHKDDLPVVNNMRGDIRLVLDESNLYVWDDAYGQDGSWVLLTGQGFNPANYYDSEQVDDLLQLKAERNHTHDTLYYRKEAVEDLVRWRPSRASFNDLPPHTENQDGDIILTRNDNTIWRWYTDDPNTGQGHWDAIVQSNFSWKTPVSSRTDLPISGNSPGDVRLVTTEEKIYYWHGAGWSAIVSDADAHTHDDRYLLKTKLFWKEPVDTFDDLPDSDNDNGDCRIALDSNFIYRWDDGLAEWIEVVQDSQWLDPVLYFSQLPLDAQESDVIYIKEYNQLYVYSDSIWKPIEAVEHNHNDLYYSKNDVDVLIDNVHNHTHDGSDSPQIDYNSLLNVPKFFWKNPVTFETDLPATDNSIGDARIVLDLKSIYTWTGSGWELISSGTFDINHNHDDRYHTKDDIQALLQNIQIDFANQLGEKADEIHTHDDRYYTKVEVDVALAEKAEHDHTHNWSHNHDDRYPTFSDLSNPNRGAQVHWDNLISVPESITDAWKTPVQSESDLPLSNNNEGDLRLVLDTSDIWRWEGSAWSIVGHWSGPQVDHWEAPVDEEIDLPTVNNQDGDIRLVKAENILYRWDVDTFSWIKMCCGDSTTDPGSGDGNIDDNDVSGLSYEEIQVYFNGLQGTEGEDWEKTASTSIRILAQVDEDDVITIIVIGDTLRRYDFRGESEGQIEINLATTFFRKEIELSVPTSLFTLPVPYNPTQKDLVVWLNGQLQRVGKDYDEISSTQFLFNRMLDIGDRIIIVILGFTSGEENYYREDYTAEDDQQVFNLIHEYAPGTKQLLVYLNGQLQLQEDDYIELDENTIRFNDREIAENDYITFIILKGLAIGGGGSIINYASDLLLGWPSDNKWSDGYVNLHSEMNVADAIDEINEALLELMPNELVSLRDLTLDTEGIDLFSGFAADGNDYIEGQPGDYFNYLTKDREFYLATPDNSFVKADIGVLRLFVNGIEVDSFNLGNAFVEGDRDGSQTATHYGIASQGADDNVGLPGSGGALRNSTNGYIRIMSISKYEYKKVQKGVVRFKLYNGILRHGYNYAYVTHSYDNVVNTTKQFKFFFDSKHVFPAFTGTQTLFEQTMNSSKYVSGIRYYSIGDVFRTTFNLTNIAYTVYSAEPIEITMPGLKPKAIEYNDPNLQQISDPPHIDDIAEYKGNFTLNEFNNFSVDGVVTIKTHTPFGVGPEYTFISKNRLVNTYTNGSSSLVEYFRDEIYRLPEGDYDTVPTQRSNVWDSSQPLQSSQAMLFDKGLRYANMNFIDYLPTQSVDYSDFSGPQTYYRAFSKNMPRNNGVFIIKGITKNDLIAEKINIDIKLPTLTGWLSLGKHYEVSEFNGEDGDGCLIDVVDDKFYYSSGTFSTAYSGYTIIARITLPNDLAPVITYMELQW